MNIKIQFLSAWLFTSITSKLVLLLLLLSISSCDEPNSVNQNQLSANKTSEQTINDFNKTLEKHLKAVRERDLVSLKSTMSPLGKMQLILPGSEIINSVDSFMNYHSEWFKDTSNKWTFETEILNTEIGTKMGIGITEVIYREPERNGEPYFNRMIVSYGLEKINNKWYIIKDHASSIEKSTDKK